MLCIADLIKALESDRRMKTITDILDVEKQLKDIDAVIFDLDDTLYSEKDYVRSGYAKVAEAFPEIENMASKLWSAFENNEQAIDYVLRSEGMMTKANHAKALSIYRNHFPDINLYDGVREMIERISNSRFVGLITDGRPEGQRNKIKALGLDSIIDCIIITDELGGIEYRKPNTFAVELMQKKANVGFERMIYIGDNIAKDFIGPEKCGMNTLYFSNCQGIYY